MEAVRVKAEDALCYAVQVANSAGPTDDCVRKTGKHGEVMDLCWHMDGAELIVAFHVPDDVSTTNGKGATLQPKCLAKGQGLKVKGNKPIVAPKLIPVLEGFFEDETLTDFLASFGKGLSNPSDVKPRRIVCTGLEAGGSIAAVVAVLLAVEYPGAAVRCVTVDSPSTTFGNDAFKCLYDLLIGFSYHLHTTADRTTMDSYGHFDIPQGLDFKPADTAPVQWESILRGALPRKGPKPENPLNPEDARKALQALLEEQHVDLPGVVEEAVEAAPRVSEKMAETLERLYENDPAGTEVSLRWMDDDVQGPFSKLDTVEKILLVGRKVASLAGMAAAAYENPETFREQTHVGDLCEFVDRESLGLGGQCHVVWRPAINTLIVAFRGTEHNSAKEWLTDGNVTKVPAKCLLDIFSGSTMHLGFLSQLNDLWDNGLTAAVDKLRKQSGSDAPVERIVVTGHSLGGALATLGGLKFAFFYPKADVQVVSWGSPRVANEDFMQAFNTLTRASLRFQYHYDAVPCVPQACSGGSTDDFVHVCQPAYLRPLVGKNGIDTESVLDLHANAPTDPVECARGVYEEGHKDVDSELKANHNMKDRYIGALVGYMQRLAKEEAGKEPIRTEE